MAPEETRRPPNQRQSCDRCHSQKLRCPQQQGPSDPNSPRPSCQRCLRLGVECVYSSSLPRGRPKLAASLLSNQAREDGNARAFVAALSALHEELPTRDSETERASQGAADATTAPPIDPSSLGRSRPPAQPFWPALPYPNITTPDSANKANSPSQPTQASPGQCSLTSSLRTGSAPSSDSPRHVRIANLPKRSDGLPKLYPPPDDDPLDQCVKRLSCLVEDIFPVYRSSRLFRELQIEYPGPHFTHASFDAVSYLLLDEAGGPTPYLAHSAASDPATANSDVPPSTSGTRPRALAPGEPFSCLFSDTNKPLRQPRCRALYRLFTASRDLLCVVHGLVQDASFLQYARTATTLGDPSKTGIYGSQPMPQSMDLDFDPTVDLPDDLFREMIATDYSGMPSSTEGSLTMSSVMHPQLDVPMTNGMDDGNDDNHTVNPIVQHLVIATYMLILYIYNSLLVVLTQEAKAAVAEGLDHESAGGSAPRTTRFMLPPTVHESQGVVLIQYIGHLFSRMRLKVNYYLRNGNGSSRAKMSMSPLEKSVQNGLEELRSCLNTPFSD